MYRWFILILSLFFIIEFSFPQGVYGKESSVKKIEIIEPKTVKKKDEKPIYEPMEASLKSLKYTFRNLKNDLKGEFSDLKTEMGELEKGLNRTSDKLKRFKEALPELEGLDLFQSYEPKIDPGKRLEFQKFYRREKIPLRFNAILKSRHPDLSDGERLQLMLEELKKKRIGP